MPSVAVGAGNGRFDRGEDSGIALVEIEGHEFGISVRAGQELGGEVVRTDRQAIEQASECIDLENVVGISHIT